MAEPTTTTINRSVDDETLAPLHVIARRHQHRLLVVTVHGEIDLSNISLLENELAAHGEEPWLVVDMSGVEFCGVVGARCLHVMAVQSSTFGRRFEVVTNPMIARMLQVTGLAGGIAVRSAPVGPVLS